MSFILRKSISARVSCRGCPALKRRSRSGSSGEAKRARLCLLRQCFGVRRPKGVFFAGPLSLSSPVLLACRGKRPLVGLSVVREGWRRSPITGASRGGRAGFSMGSGSNVHELLSATKSVLARLDSREIQQQQVRPAQSGRRSRPPSAWLPGCSQHHPAAAHPPAPTHPTRRTVACAQWPLASRRQEKRAIWWPWRAPYFGGPP